MTSKAWHWQARALLRDGLSAAEISRRLKRSDASVRYALGYRWKRQYTEWPVVVSDDEHQHHLVDMDLSEFIKI